MRTRILAYIVAPHTGSGNPRRFWVVSEDRGGVVVVDEDYWGHSALSVVPGALDSWHTDLFPTINVTVTEYRRLRQQYGSVD